MNDPMNGQTQAAEVVRTIHITEIAGQWQLEANVLPLDVMCVLLELGKNIALKEASKNQSKIEVPNLITMPAGRA